jgi:hypothetical protein
MTVKPVVAPVSSDQPSDQPSKKEKQEKSMMADWEKELKLKENQTVHETRFA